MKMKYKTGSLNEMNSETSGFADDLEQALSVKIDIFRKYRHILISGMGTSMIRERCSPGRRTTSPTFQWT